MKEFFITPECQRSLQTHLIPVRRRAKTTKMQRAMTWSLLVCLLPLTLRTFLFLFYHKNRWIFTIWMCGCFQVSWNQGRASRLLSVAISSLTAVIKLRVQVNLFPWADVAFLTENNNTIILWLPGDEDNSPLYSPVSLEEPPPSDDDYDDVGSWKAHWKKNSRQTKTHTRLGCWIREHAVGCTSKHRDSCCFCSFSVVPCVSVKRMLKEFVKNDVSWTEHNKLKLVTEICQNN